MRFQIPETEREVGKPPVTQARTAKKEQLRRKRETGKEIPSLKVASEDDDDENGYYHVCPKWVSTLTKPLSLDLPKPVIVEEKMVDRGTENDFPPEELMEKNTSHILLGSKGNLLTEERVRVDILLEGR